MARIQAITSNRAVVYASTTGESAIISPAGAVLARSGLWQRAELEARVPLRTGLTLADRLGGWPEAVLTGLAIAALALAIGLTVRDRRAGQRSTAPAGGGAAAAGGGSAAAGRGSAAAGGGSAAPAGESAAPTGGGTAHN
jgi:apolipoprotein N-acyltransferase